MASKYLAADNLPSWLPVHHFNQSPSRYSTGVELVDVRKKSLWVFLAMVAFNPIFWNTVARNGE
jgi:phosphatidylethanolamine N-methyltransferase